MATNYLSLDEAARFLGISSDRLVELRSQGQVRGFRDGASWKFPQEEISRLREELGEGLGSDIGLGSEGAGSDVALVQGAGEGSEVQLVASRSGAPLEVVENQQEEDAYELAPEGTSNVDLGVDPTDGSTGPGPLSDIRIQGDSGVDLDDALSEDDDLVIADDDDDLVLSSGGSDISIADDSGINLMSPSDSGLSLESEPLDMAGSSISALDLGSAVTRSPAAGGSGSGSLVDFKADEEFQLSPSSIGIETDDDSGSQVIEVEDSTAFTPGDFGGAPSFTTGGLEEEPVFGGAIEADAVLVGAGDEGSPAFAAAGGPVAIPYETPFTIWQVISLASIMLLLCICGMVMTDLMGNLWAYEEPAAPVSSLTNALISMFGFE